MLAIIQGIEVVYPNSFNMVDLEYLAYQLVNKHGYTTVYNMDNEIIKKEIDKLTME